MLSFSNAPGNFFNRIGTLGQLVKLASAYQGNLLPALTSTSTGVVAQYNGESDLQAQVGNAYVGILNGAGSSIGGLVQSLAQQTLSRMIFRDNAQLSQTLQGVQVNSSIAELIRQMNIAGAKVLAMNVSSTLNPFVGTGNGISVASTIRPFDGRTLENSFSETLTIRCIADSYLNGALPGNETFSVTGQGAETNVFAFDWPLGSNCSINLQAINGAASASQGNLLTNSALFNWSNSQPNNYVVDSGLGILNQENTITYNGPYALRITGNGATLLQLRQQFNSSTGTVTALQPITQYSFNVFLRNDGVSPAAGTLVVDLVDGNMNTIADAGQNLNTFTVSLTTLTQFYTAYNVVFRTPEILPAQQFLRIRNGVALSSGRSVYLANSSMGIMSQLYGVGPYVSVHSGSIPFVAGSPQPDYAYVSTTNSRGAGGTLSTFQTLMSQLFPQMYQTGYLLPSSSVPSISDTLII
jgi:hypothetical protein